jgi:hypothetical protein
VTGAGVTAAGPTGRRSVLAGGLALVAGPAFGIDPGVVTGGYRDDDLDVAFAHAVALERDNTEGLMDHAREIRVALTDREVPASALFGQGFPPIWHMAVRGEVRGVILSFDPADRTGMVVTVLARPEPGFSLANVTISNSEGLWSRLEIAPTRISGELRAGASGKLTARFSAPVFNDRVVADLKGPAAAAAEPTRAVLARAEAIVRGDMPAALALSTEASAVRLREIPPETLALAKREVPRLIARLKSVKRVVVREQTAVIFLGPGEYATAAREGGAWKVAD